MKKTIARKHFKQMLGQANHFLITTLIGLNCVENNNDIEKPQEFSTSWNPKNIFNSARRSREYILNSALAWTVDSLEAYMSLIHKKPKIIEDEKFSVMMSEAGRSVYKKVLGYSEYFEVDKTLTSLMELLITWRNNITHFTAENKLPENSKQHLLESNKEILDNYSGLAIDTAIKKAEKGKSPSFKECASLIHATQQFVEKIDTIILENMDKKIYAENIFKYYFENDKKKKKSKFLGHTLQDREKVLKNILSNLGGFNDVDETILSYLLSIKAEQV